MPTLLSLEAMESERHFVLRQLEVADESPWGTAKLMWKNKLDEIDQRVKEINSSSSNFANVALIFNGNPVIGQSDIRLDFAAGALDSYQKIVSIALASRNSKELSKRGPLPGSERAQLFIRDLARGSVGFILEEIPVDQSELLPTVLKEAVEGTTELLNTLSGSSEGEFDKAIEDAQPRLVEAMLGFAKLLHTAGASARIVGDQHLLNLSWEQAGELSKRLSEVSSIEESVDIKGVLLGILPEAHQFELRPDGENTELIRGNVSEELLEKYLKDQTFIEQLLLKQVVAKIRHVKTTRNGREIREKRILESIHSTPS